MKPLIPFTILICALPAWAQNPLSVRVIDESGQPIAGAVVTARIYAKDAPVIAPLITDTGGKVAFSLLDDNGKLASASIMAGARGYSFNGAQSDPKNASLEIRLARGQFWRGKVVDEKGAPLAGARIAIEGAGKAFAFGHSLFIESEAIKTLYSATSKADGSFEIADLPADKELFYRVSLAGYAPQTSQSGRVDNPPTFALARSGALRGRALDINGKPLTGIQIYAKSREPFEISDLAPTDANGDFLIQGVPPGVYQLGIGSPSELPFLMPPSASVRVEVGKTATAGEWRAMTGVEIRGFVTDAVSKKPVEGASFAAQTKADEKSGDDSAWATSDATGHFVLRVLPGDYRVRSGGNAPGHLKSDTIRSAQPRAGTPAQVSFELQSAPIVRGITRAESGAPIQAQLIVGSFGQTLDTDAQGHWQYTPYDSRDISFGGGEDQSGYFDVVSPKRLSFPAKGPITVTVRHKPWQSLAGRVVTPDGAPIEGAKVTASFGVALSDRISRGAQSSALSDADGRYVLRKLRDSRVPNVGGTEVEVSAQKEGFDFQSGGVITRENNQPRVSDLVLAPLSASVKGTTTPGARVVAAGRETRADDAGRFSFDALPQGQTVIYAAKDELFGSAQATTAPLEIALARPTLQGRDEELAREIWAKNIEGAVEDEVLDLDDWRNQNDALRGLRRAQRSGEQWRIAGALGRWQASDSAQSWEIAREILDEMAPSEARTGAYLSVALNADDAALTKRALEIARAQFESATTEIYERERQMYQAAVLTERQDGTGAGALALRAALAFTLKNRPAQSRVEGAREVATGRGEALSRVVDIVALGSPALLRELLDNIDNGSGAQVSALAQAIPVFARTHGYEAAQPWLEELRDFPAPALNTNAHPLLYDVDFALGYAVQSVIPVIGATDATAALEWARAVQGDEQSARALASAARFAPQDVAAVLLREAAETIGSDNAPRVAAAAYERDARLGAELFEIARQKAEADSHNPLMAGNAWIAFAFNYARANPAQARLILEREWAKGREAKIDDDELSLIAAAMAPIDARRAAEMADELSAQSANAALNARIKIARYLVADDATRRGLVLRRIGAREPWDAGELQW